MALPLRYSLRSLSIRWKSALLAMIGIALVVDCCAHADHLRPPRRVKRTIESTGDLLAGLLAPGKGSLWYAAAVMRRPFGVTVIMSMFLLTAFIAVNQLLHGGHKPQFVALWVGNLAVGLGLGLALYGIKWWSRWPSIVTSAASLVVIPPQLAVVHGSILAIVVIGCRALFMVWAIWYMFRPQVKSAFQASQGKVQATC